MRKYEIYHIFIYKSCLTLAKSKDEFSEGSQKKKKFNLYVLLMVKTYKLKKTKQVH